MKQNFFLILLSLVVTFSLHGMAFLQGDNLRNVRVDLSNRSITNFVLADYIKNYPNLKELDLSGNKISKLKSMMLEGIPNEFTLNLQNNLITEVDDDCYHTVPYYTNCIIDLRNNFLSAKQKKKVNTIIYNPDYIREYLGYFLCSGGCCLLSAKVADISSTACGALMVAKSLIVPPLAIIGCAIGTCCWETCAKDDDDTNELAVQIKY